MPADPWTAPDPQPGDFDAELSTIDPQHVEHRDGDPNATLRVLLHLKDDVARHLEQFAAARGRTPSDALAELLREAERSAA